MYKKILVNLGDFFPTIVYVFVVIDLQFCGFPVAKKYFLLRRHFQLDILPLSHIYEHFFFKFHIVVVFTDPLIKIHFQMLMDFG